MELVYPILDYQHWSKRNPIFSQQNVNQRKLIQKYGIKSLTIFRRSVISEKPCGGIDITREFYNKNGQILLGTWDVSSYDEFHIIKYDYYYDKENRLIKKQLHVLRILTLITILVAHI